MVVDFKLEPRLALTNIYKVTGIIPLSSPTRDNWKLWAPTRDLGKASSISLFVPISTRLETLEDCGIIIDCFIAASNRKTDRNV